MFREKFFCYFGVLSVLLNLPNTSVLHYCSNKTLTIVRVCSYEETWSILNDFPSNVSLAKENFYNKIWMNFLIHPWSISTGRIGYRSVLLRHVMLEGCSWEYRYCRCSIAISGMEVSNQMKTCSFYWRKTGYSNH